MEPQRQSDSSKTKESKKKDIASSAGITKGKLNSKKQQKRDVKHGSCLRKDAGDYLLQAEKYIREKKKYKCGECGKLLSHGSHVEEHRRTHSQEYLFTCYECGKKFSRKFNLEKHQVTHSGRCHQAVTSKKLAQKYHQYRHKPHVEMQVV